MRAVELKLRQRAIAEAMGVSEPTMSAWLCGNRPVPRNRAEQMAGILDLPIREIIGDTHTDQPSTEGHNARES